MSELDLTEAIEAGKVAARSELFYPGVPMPTPRELQTVRQSAEAAVRAAAPIIERAVREAIVADLDEWTDELRHNYRKGTGIEYINGIEHAALRVLPEEAATDG